MKKKNKARRYILAGLICLAAIAAGVVFIFYPIWEAKRDDQIVKEEAMEKYGVNRELTGTDYDSALAAVCDNGTFIGRETEGVYSFKGIPYAKPPVGELRWKPPVDARPDDGVYEAWYFGKSGIQTEAHTERASYYPQGEDCLTLNVWTCPDEAGAAASQTRRKKAVKVFFHGGAYGWGGTADPIYDGQNFVKAHGDSLFIYTDGVTEGTNAALEEIFVNIANYAYGNREGEAQIAFSYEEKNKMIEMVFSDRGIPFDPTNRPAPARSMTKRMGEKCERKESILKKQVFPQVFSAVCADYPGLCGGLQYVVPLHLFAELPGRRRRAGAAEGFGACHAD